MKKQNKSAAGRKRRGRPAEPLVTLEFIQNEKAAGNMR
jgi:hypothetical protein